MYLPVVRFKWHQTFTTLSTESGTQRGSNWYQLLFSRQTWPLNEFPGNEGDIHSCHLLKFGRVPYASPLIPFFLQWKSPFETLHCQIHFHKYCTLTSFFFFFALWLLSFSLFLFFLMLHSIIPCPNFYIQKDDKNKRKWSIGY